MDIHTEMNFILQRRKFREKVSFINFKFHIFMPSLAINNSFSHNCHPYLNLFVITFKIFRFLTQCAYLNKIISKMPPYKTNMSVSVPFSCSSDLCRLALMLFSHCFHHFNNFPCFCIKRLVDQEMEMDLSDTNMIHAFLSLCCNVTELDTLIVALCLIILNTHVPRPCSTSSWSSSIIYSWVRLFPNYYMCNNFAPDIFLQRLFV